jgi:hypothetical protein
MAQGQTRGGHEEPYAEISAAQAAQQGLRQVVGLTGKDAVGVVSVEPIDEGWRVAVEVVEDRRVPASTDMLSIYEADLDLGGDLLGCQRTRRYQRGKADGG